MSKRKSVNPNESVFSLRFCQLMDNHEPKLTQEELGKILGVSKSSISFYRDGTNQPNYSILTKIANYFHCSADYLLGLSDCRDLSPDQRMVCEYLGVSEHTAKDLKQLLNNEYDDEITRQRIHKAFANLTESPRFSGLLESIQSFCDVCDGIAADSYTEPDINTFSYEGLQGEAASIQQDIEQLEFQRYKEISAFSKMFDEIAGFDELVLNRKNRQKKINTRLGEKESEKIIQ